MVSRENDPWYLGYMAVMDCTWDGKDISDCPYEEGSPESDAWQSGINAAWEDECPPTD